MAHTPSYSDGWGSDGCGWDAAAAVGQLRHCCRAAVTAKAEEAMAAAGTQVALN